MCIFKRYYLGLRIEVKMDEPKKELIAIDTATSITFFPVAGY